MRNITVRCIKRVVSPRGICFIEGKQYQAKQYTNGCIQAINEHGGHHDISDEGEGGIESPWFKERFKVVSKDIEIKVIFTDEEIDQMTEMMAEYKGDPREFGLNKTYYMGLIGRLLEAHEGQMKDNGINIRVVLTTSEGEKEENVTIPSLVLLTSTLAKLIDKHNATAVEAFEGENRIAVLDVGRRREE